jgi:plastocyanin
VRWFAIAGVIAAIAVVSAIAQPADRGTVRGTIKVNRPAGVPASPILVYLVGFTESAPSTPVTITQQNRKFVPDLVAVTAGQTIGFPNRDPLLHNVFSPTEERTFDLGSFDKGETRTRGFPRPGVIEIYCNIHPEMSATLVVVPNRKFAIAKPSGEFEIADVPAGTWSIFAYSRRAAKPSRGTVTVTANGTATVALQLDEVKRDFTHANKFGEGYREDGVIYNGD